MKPADGVVEDARRVAHARAGQPYVPAPGPPHHAAAVPALLPITVCVSDGTAHGEICESLLWKLGDPAWQPKAVAARLVQDLAPLAANAAPPTAAVAAATVATAARVEKEIEEQLEWSLRGVRGWRDLGPGPQLVHIKVYVQNGGSALVDELDWDVNNPMNSAHAYAASVCADLGLGVAWYDLIEGYMQTRLEDARTDLAAGLLPSADEAVGPSGDDAGGGGSVLRAVPLPGDMPRIEDFDAAKDTEAVRQKARAASGSRGSKRKSEVEAERVPDSKAA
ncbi:hypothetical protein FOA52_014363 [Chlamydomonas sp. UWO 241]|nr:hypothetical protein FOA52_014363 [Chlamydomonas sp. UWO 241]